MPASTSPHTLLTYPQIQCPDIIQCLHPPLSTKHPNLPFIQHSRMCAPRWDVALGDGPGPSVGGVEDKDGVVLGALAAAVDAAVVNEA
jgi:hypothetical protein